MCYTTAQEKEKNCAGLEEILEQNPGKRILLVLDNFLYPFTHARESALMPSGLTSFFKLGSPHLNPIEPVLKSLK